MAQTVVGFFSQSAKRFKSSLVVQLCAHFFLKNEAIVYCVPCCSMERAYCCVLPRPRISTVKTMIYFKKVNTAGLILLHISEVLDIGLEWVCQFLVTKLFFSFFFFLTFIGWVLLTFTDTFPFNLTSEDKKTLSHSCY